MNLKIISWNVRGLNDKGKRNIIKSLIQEWRADIYCFQETKLEGNVYMFVKEIWGNRWEFTWHITGVYGSNDRIERQGLWWELAANRGAYTGPWVICGDFNITRYAAERRNCTRRNRAMIEFSDLINELELIDLPLEGGIYTWYKGINHLVASRLDRFLVSTEWDEEFRPDYILATKLKLLKAKLKEWSSSNYGNLGAKKSALLEQLLQFDRILEQRNLTDDELITKANVEIMKFHEIAKYEETTWRQRSRVLWLKQGDKNTKFFHRMANAHRRFNTLDKLEINGEQITDSEVIIKEIVEFYIC
ncbi:PREDICTED: uncharacterized protein LOC109243827 [Nicotiana attenuata]|uniref:uncharacterized protein LOC109243827 n=1 Tax=Nicotiana attenuata TaxID=49451 RepID=UPI00090498D5|nr:PREDICTED: uncharacterized protein LOC109243827 [Nicotiana attenuata]